MKSVSIVGSRKLPDKYRFHVREVVAYLLERGSYINSGGAMGADSYAIAALLRYGKAYKGVIYSAWSYFSGFPCSVREQISEFMRKGGKIDWGKVLPDPSRQEVVAGLLGRNRRLVENSDMLIAYLYGESRGTSYTIREAVKKGIPVIVFRCSEDVKLPEIGEEWNLIKSSNALKNGYYLKPKVLAEKEEVSMTTY